MGRTKKAIKNNPIRIAINFNKKSLNIFNNYELFQVQLIIYKDFNAC